MMLSWHRKKVSWWREGVTRFVHMGVQVLEELRRSYRMICILLVFLFFSESENKDENREYEEQGSDME